MPNAAWPRYGHTPGERRNKPHHRQRGIPREARRVEKPPGFVLSGPGNENSNNGADDERDILDARLAAFAAGEEVEAEEPAARVRAVRRGSTARHAGADRERARALRAGRARRAARVVDAVTGNFAGCARPA